VVSRRIDSERDHDGRWHALGRAFVASAGASPPTGRGARVAVHEFGSSEISIDGVPAHPRLKKSFELLAYLLSHPERSATRAELLDALFDGRSDPSASAYLRQAILRLRQVLPEGIAPVSQDGRVCLPDPDAVISDAGRFQRLVAEAACVRGTMRVDMLRAALRLVQAGPYLPDVGSEWVTERRRVLADQTREAQIEAATVAFEQGSYPEARELVDTALLVDPFAECGWRLAMSIAHAVGDQDGLLSLFRRCRATLHGVGVDPSPVTVGHFHALRGVVSSTTSLA
jgi:DNA-binding SARP family transcriptional activator